MTVSRPRRTPLHALHVALGARLVEFAGWELPLHYVNGILREHAHVRAAAGLFDVSHMGQVQLAGPDVAAALEALVPSDIVGLATGALRYTVLTSDAGGVLDDLIVGAGADALYLVVNAAMRAADLAHLRARLPGSIDVRELDDRALLALQGPAAQSVLARLAPGCAALGFMSAATLELLGQPCRVSRTGYTGEDGFEISVPAAAAETLARRLLSEAEVAPVGLGARDSLRLEAGLCLYGHELDAATSPVEAGIAFVVGRSRREGGARAGGFPGAERILAELREGPAQVRVGLLPEGKAPVRDGTPLRTPAGAPAGRVTSGTFAPTLGRPVAMGFVPLAQSPPGTVLLAEVRGQPRPLEVVALPFVPHRYHRGRPATR